MCVYTHRSLSLSLSISISISLYVLLIFPEIKIAFWMTLRGVVACFKLQVDKGWRQASKYRLTMRKSANANVKSAPSGTVLGQLWGSFGEALGQLWGSSRAGLGTPLGKLWDTFQ